MRQIATLPEEDARRFADYLLTLKVQTQLISEEGGQGVWVCDEDKVEQARKELAEFRRNPVDFRYAKSTAVAQTLRQKEARVERDYARRQHRLEHRMASAGTAANRGVTIALLVISIVVTLGSNFGKSASPVTQTVSIAPYTVEDHMVRWRWLEAVRSGEVWRLVTPIFLHLSPLHLGFNMLMLISLGGGVEEA